MFRNQTKFISLILIIIVGFAIYGNSLHNKFLWDDELLILNNEYIKDLHNIPGLFIKSVTYGTPIESNTYRPLQMFTYALNYAFCKLDARAYHLTNIAIHILVAIALYQLAQLIFKNEFLSLTTALLFISHPIHTEAVTYISGRADPLAALFILFSVICYIKYTHNENKISFYSLSLVSYLFALLSKEVALVVPLLLIAYDYIYKERKRLALKIHLPFFLVGFIYILLRKTILDFPTTRTIFQQVPFPLRILLIFKSLTMYLQKLFLPLNLHPEYELIIPPLTDIQLLLGVVIAGVLIWLAIAYRKRAKLISFSIAWFLINYLPISNIYPLNAFFAEHWIYTPSLGLFILAAWAATKICEKGQLFKLLTCLMLTFLLLGNFLLTSKQNQYWSNPEDFYKRTLEYNPHSARVYYRLALLYFRKGMVDKGIEASKQALEINPDFLSAYENLAAGYLIKGCPDKVIDVGKKALEIGPNSFLLHNTLGMAYSAKGLNEQALMKIKKAIFINPDYAQAHNNLGTIYAVIGQSKQAIASFKNALKIKPNFAAVHSNLARAYYDIKRYDLAIKHCDRAIELGFRVPLEFLELLEHFR